MALDPVMTALIALHFHPELTPSARRIGAALLEHFNRKSGQCNPTVTRLAELLDTDVKTVKRGTAELEQKGLISKSRIFGKRRTNYQPNWSAFAAIYADWRLRFGGGELGAEMSPDGGRKSPLFGGEIVPQTYRKTNRTEPSVIPITASARTRKSAEKQMCADIANSCLSAGIWERLQEDRLLYEASVDAEWRNRGGGMKCIQGAIRRSA